jgi:butyryl-CoA dehydrogenase
MTTLAASPSPVLAVPGGSFLVEERAPSEIFTPEDLNEEQRQIAATAARFAREEIHPAVDAVEAKEPDALRALMRKAAELGFAGVNIPEEYGGMGMDKTASTLITDHIAGLASFSVAFACQIGIASLPLVWYGTEDQKRRYLPRLASCDWIASYSLSESTSGSDAMNIRTRATLSPDGRHYILNGEKHWISNGGIADLYTVFAKIDGEKFTAFLVERNTPGLSVGPEEHKMGIRGSSTCPLILQDCKVPVENLLGEPGRGHRIAFTALNMGRFKIGSSCLGGARQVLSQMIRYASERRAFGKPIAEFGLIQRKISSSSARLYAAESMVYRTVAMIDASLAGIEGGEIASPHETERRIGEYVAECSILKVYGSEMLAFLVDELVATMGGYGFVEDYPAERYYRDARINRIFEGTNEINRLLLTGWLLKRAAAGKLPLQAAIKRTIDEVMQPPSYSFADENGRPLGRETGMLASLKKIALFAAGVAGQRFMTALPEQQEVMADLSDLVIEVYAFESVLLRAQKLAAAGRSTARVAAAMTGLLADESLPRAEQAARRILAACGTGDELATQLAILRRLARFTPADTVALSRSVAREAIAAERYPL